MTEPLFRPETKELAFRIYSDLIGRNIAPDLGTNVKAAGP